MRKDLGGAPHGRVEPGIRSGARFKEERDFLSRKIPERDPLIEPSSVPWIGFGIDLLLEERPGISLFIPTLFRHGPALQDSNGEFVPKPPPCGERGTGIDFNLFLVKSLKNNFPILELNARFIPILIPKQFFKG